MTDKEKFESYVFMIAKALVESGKHTNRYDLAREAFPKNIRRSWSNGIHNNRCSNSIRLCTTSVFSTLHRVYNG